MGSFSTSSQVSKVASLLLAIFAATGMMFLFEIWHWRQFHALMLLIVGVPVMGGLALATLIPWPVYPLIPKIHSRIPRRKAGPLITLALLLLALVPLAVFAFSDDSPFFYVVSGKMLASSFDQSHVGGALDQPSLTKWFYIFVCFSAMVLPYVAMVRWLSDRDTQWRHWAFAIPTIALAAYLLIHLTLPFFWLLQYIGAMGFTLRRVLGLIYGVAGYVAIVWFSVWAIGKRP